MKLAVLLAWGPGRLDVVGVGLDEAMFPKTWAAGWSPSQTDWDGIGGDLRPRT